MVTLKPKMKQIQKTSHRHLQRRVVLIAVCFVAYIAYSFVGKKSTGTGTTTKHLASKAPEVDEPVRSTFEGSEYFWQRPSSSKPRGILFMGHGCQHSMTDWWVSSASGCPECIGLPEELAIVRLALEKYQLVVVAMSSLDRVGSKCWSPSDGPRVAKVLLQIQKEFNGSLPILAFGASSGGHFVSTSLPKAVKDIGAELAGFISQIMGARPSVHSIPAVYITMDRDQHTNDAASDICLELKSTNVPAKHLRLPPLPITSGYFSERITTVSLNQSKRMVEALYTAGLLNEETGMLKDDPRQSNWRSALSEHKGDDSMVADQSPLSEVLNVAWSMHEMSRNGVDEALDFLLGAVKTKN